MKTMDPSTTVIFLHIPRTGGKTLIRIFEGMIAKDNIYNFNIKNNEDINKLYSRSEANNLYNERLETFRALSEKERGKIKFLHGHITHGVHNYLPGPSGYITFLRNPIDRIVSSFCYFRETREGFLYEQAELRVDDIFCMENKVKMDIMPLYRNLQTEMLAGISCPAPGMLQKAKNNLDSLILAGLTERFEETLMLIKKAFGWKSFPYYRNLNANTNRLKLQDIPVKIIRMIEKHNELDCELYEYAKKKFEERVRYEFKTLIPVSGFAQMGSDSSGDKPGDQDLLEKTDVELLIQRDKLEGALKAIKRLELELDRKNKDLLLERGRADRLKEKLRKRNENITVYKEKIRSYKEKINNKDEMIRFLERRFRLRSGTVKAFKETKLWLKNKIENYF